MAAEATAAYGTLSCTFLPLQRPKKREAALAGFTSPDSLRPQVFSTSRRLTPPCSPSGLFHPDAVLGVDALQRFSLTGGRTPLGWSCPSWRWYRNTRLQGFEPPVNPCLHSLTREGMRAADPLLGFILSKVSPSRRPTLSTRPPLMRFRMSPSRRTCSPRRSRVSIDRGLSCLF